MIIQRSYNPESDFERINQFLRDCYEPENADGNWCNGNHAAYKSTEGHHP